MSAISLIQESINEAIEHSQPVGNLSDGYHTFNELYKHRIALFKALCKIASYTIDSCDNGCYSFSYEETAVWYSDTHHDGSVVNGWFIAGLSMSDGRQLTYHIPNSEMSDWPGQRVLRAPEWDGHTSTDVLKRLAEL